MNTSGGSAETAEYRSTSAPVNLGYWHPGSSGRILHARESAPLLHDYHTPLAVVGHHRQPALAIGGHIEPTNTAADSQPLRGIIPPCHPEDLGDPSFRADHRLRCACLAGAMANGIGSEAIVIAMARAGMLGFFGAAGLSIPRVEAAIDRITQELDGEPFGFNLIHSPNEADLEAAVVGLYIRRGIRLVEASAYLQLTLPVVRYRVHGIHRNEQGQVVTPNQIIAKVSRVEVAAKFFAPPPEKFLQQLVETGHISAEQALLAREIPMAQDITAEADSGGHTDNRPAIALFPTLCALRDRMREEYPCHIPLRVGLAGGISTPASAAAAFAMGAAYVLTGSINQACVEAGTSDTVRAMLAEAGQADVAMAPAADMFEMGVNLQVLKRGTMFSMRASKLYELYRACGSLDAIPAPDREKLEKTTFRMPLEEVWRQTEAFFAERDPRQIERAARDPKHKMALVFRWYLGQSSNWANSGDPDRKLDYQVWCGPAMGAFNEWVKDTPFQAPENRHVAPINLSILHGAAVLHRVNTARLLGLPLPTEAARIIPRLGGNGNAAPLRTAQTLGTNT